MAPTVHDLNASQEASMQQQNYGRELLSNATQRVRPDVRGGRANGHVNLHDAERVASGLVGTMALMWGLKHRSPWGAAAALVGGGLLYRGASGHCHLYESLGVSTALPSGPQRQGVRALLPAPHKVPPRHYEIIREVTLQNSPQEVYAAWKRPELLSQVMSHFAELTSSEGGRTRWTIAAPLGRSFSWETELLEDKPNELIRWSTVQGAPMLKRGSLKLKQAPGDRGTEVTLHLHFERPHGMLGDALEAVLGPVPSAFAQRALFHLKCLLEAGELPSLRNNPAARASAKA